MVYLLLSPFVFRRFGSEKALDPGGREILRQFGSHHFPQDNKSHKKSPEFADVWFRDRAGNSGGIGSPNRFDAQTSGKDDSMGRSSRPNGSKTEELRYRFWEAAEEDLNHAVDHHEEMRSGYGRKFWNEFET